MDLLSFLLQQMDLVAVVAVFVIGVSGSESLLFQPDHRYNHTN